jgi:hypothetical protein
VERCHLTPERCSRPRRPRTRVCLRKGCGRRYQPRRWNQRYCQDAKCLRQLRRWQAAQRQARRRQDDAVKAEHAAAERVRRQNARCQRAAVSAQAPDKPKVGAARGHAAKIFLPIPYARGRGAMKPPRSWAATRHTTVARTAAKRSAGCWIANASGFGVARSRAGANALGNIKPPGHDVLDNKHSKPIEPGRRHGRRRGREQMQQYRSAVDGPVWQES